MKKDFISLVDFFLFLVLCDEGCYYSITAFEILLTTLITLLHSPPVDVTLDPDTAAAWLVLSSDGKKVKSGKVIIIIWNRFFFQSSHIDKKCRYWCDQ